MFDADCPVSEAGWAPSLCALDVICLQEFKGAAGNQKAFFANMAKRGYDHVQVRFLGDLSRWRLRCWIC